MSTTDEKIDTLTENLTALGDKVDVLGGNLSALGDKVDVLGGNLSALGEKVDVLGGNLTALGEKVDVLGGNLTVLEEKVDGLINTAATKEDLRVLSEAMEAGFTETQKDIADLGNMVYERTDKLMAGLSIQSVAD